MAECIHQQYYCSYLRFYTGLAWDGFLERFIKQWIVKLLSHLQNNDTLDWLPHLWNSLYTDTSVQAAAHWPLREFKIWFMEKNGHKLFHISSLIDSWRSKTARPMAGLMQVMFTGFCYKCRTLHYGNSQSWLYTI